MSNNDVGQFAQHALRETIAAIGPGWQAAINKRNKLVSELQVLDQQIARYAQCHRELSAGIAVLDQVIPPWTTEQMLQAPDSVDGCQQPPTPSKAPTAYLIIPTPEGHQP